MDLPSLHTIFLPKLLSTDLRNALSTITALHTTLLQIKELNSQQKKWGNGPMFMGFTGISMFSTNSWEAGLIKQLNGLLKTLLQCHLVSNVLQSWGKVLQKVLCSLDQCPLCGAISLIARIHYSRNQGVEKDVTSLTIISSDHSWNFCSLLANLCSAA